MLQIGGVGLNLLKENIVNVGKSIEVVDLKSKSGSKRTFKIQLPHSTIFMGIAAFGNKVYISGGRNVFG